MARGRRRGLADDLVLRARKSRVARVCATLPWPIEDFFRRSAVGVDSRGNAPPFLFVRDGSGIIPRFWAVFLSALLPLVLIAGTLSTAPVPLRESSGASWKKAADPLQLAVIRAERGEFKFSSAPNKTASKIPWLWTGPDAWTILGRRITRALSVAVPLASPVLERSSWVGVVELRI